MIVTKNCIHANFAVFLTFFDRVWKAMIKRNIINYHIKQKAFIDANGYLATNLWRI